MVDVVLPMCTPRVLLRAVLPGDESDVLAYRSRDDVARFLRTDPLRAAHAAAVVDDRIHATRTCTTPRR